MLKRYDELKEKLVLDVEELSNDELINYYKDISKNLKKVSIKFYTLIALAAGCGLSTFPIKSINNIDVSTILAYGLSIGFIVCSANFYSLMCSIDVKIDEIKEITKKRNLTL